MKTLAIQVAENNSEKLDVLMRFALAEMEHQGIETELIRFDGPSIRRCSGCRKRLFGDNGYCAITGSPTDECMLEMIGADAIILGATRRLSTLVEEVFALMDDAGLAVPQSVKHDMFHISKVVRENDEEVGIAAFDMNSRFLYAKNVSHGIGHTVRKDTDASSEEIMRDLGFNLSLLLTNFKCMRAQNG